MPGKTSKQEAKNVQLSLVRIYAKDISFEAPHVTDILLREKQPVDGQATVEPVLNFRFKAMKNEIVESVAHLKLNAKSGSLVLYLVELQLVALIAVRGVKGEEEMLALARQAVPSIMLPHISELVSNLTTRSSLPPVDLINLEVNTTGGLHGQEAEGVASDEAKGAEASEAN